MACHAAEHGYAGAVPGFDIPNMETGIAIMTVAREATAPVILAAHGGYADDKLLARLVDGLVETFPAIPVCMHLDLGSNLAACAPAIRHSFTSVMRRFA